MQKEKVALTLVGIKRFVSKKGNNVCLLSVRMIRVRSVRRFVKSSFRRIRSMILVLMISARPLSLSMVSTITVDRKSLVSRLNNRLHGDCKRG